MIGKCVAALDKVVYLDNRRFLPHEHELCLDCKEFPGHIVEMHPSPELTSNTDILWNSVANSRAKNPTQAANIAKATGSKGCHSFMPLQQFDRTKQAFPDMVHVLKNVTAEFHALFTGSGDSLKVRKSEEELQRFDDSWVNDEQIAENVSIGKS